MGTKVNSNYEDLINFVRASSPNNTGAMALRPVSYGTQLVENGTFNSDLSDWTDDLSKWSVSGSRAYHAPNSTFAVLRQSVPLTVGKVYRITFDYEVLQGQLRCQARDSSNQPNGDTLAIHDLTGTGSASVIFVPDADYDSIGFARDDPGVTGEMYVDNVSVKEVLFDQPDGTLTLFPHPENVPRVEWDSAGNRLGLLVEEQRTNLVVYSEDFTTGWSRSNLLPFGSGSTSNAVVAPDGTMTADLIVPTTASNNSHFIRTTAQPNVGVGTVATFSVFVKAAGYTTLSLRLINTDATSIINYDLEAVTASDSDGSITAVGNGWYRCTIKGASTTGTAWPWIYPNQQATFAGDGTSGIYVWGAQVEVGSFPTSYIKNEGTSSGVTRSADVAKIPVADFGYNYTNTVGTFLVDWNTFSTGAGRVFAATSSSSASGNRAVDMNFNISSSRFDVYSNHTAGDLYGLGTPLTVGNKVAAAMEENDSAAVLNGGTVDTDTATGTPITATHFHLGNYGTEWLNGHIKSIKYYPRRLTNAQLQDLTS